MKDVFEQIAKHENGELLTSYNKLVNIDSSCFFICKYELEIPFKNHSIKIYNEFGNSNLGKFELFLSSKSNLPWFKVNNKSHFWKLFHRKSNILVVLCKNISFKENLQSLLLSTGLEQVARENLFEPTIYININNEKQQSIVCDYHLEFENKEAAVESLIKFYKAIIDLYL